MKNAAFFVKKRIFKPLKQKPLSTRPQIKLSEGFAAYKPVIFIDFDFNRSGVNSIRNDGNTHYIPSQKRWYLLRSTFNLPNFFNSFNDDFYMNYSEPGSRKKPDIQTPPVRDNTHRVTMELPEGYFAVLKHKRYSKSTIKTYPAYFEDFQHFFNKGNLYELSVDSINECILYLVKTWQLSSSEQNQRISAINFFYEKVLHNKRHVYEIERPRKVRILPDVLSKNKIKQTHEATNNRKHKTILRAIYSCGLRRSELVRLKTNDADSERMVIKIAGANGKKHPYVPLAKKSLDYLNAYYNNDNPGIFVFEVKPGKKFRNPFDDKFFDDG